MRDVAVAPSAAASGRPSTWARAVILPGARIDERFLTPTPIFDQLHSAAFGHNPNFRF